ncbi:MAG: prepilin-type N-terminal cleavage/methylation domain-containing protein [Planctomycetota bacterium]
MFVSNSPQSRAGARHAFVRHGFTLVELLVVIGIIALLISILLPSLQSARAQAASVKCLSNMRQTALAHVIYNTENDGYVVKADVRAPGLGRIKMWHNFLTEPGYLDAPTTDGPLELPQADSVFRCPEGTDIPWSTGLSFTDASQSGFDAFPNNRDPVTNAPDPVDPQWVHLWYGINATTGNNNIDTYLPSPIHRDEDFVWGGQVYRITYKASSLEKPAELVFTYDGSNFNLAVGFNPEQGGAYRIAARHPNEKANMSFFDGHVESVPVATFPEPRIDFNTVTPDMPVEFYMMNKVRGIIRPTIPYFQQ